jgi:hypothetical protein
LNGQNHKHLAPPPGSSPLTLPPLSPPSTPFGEARGWFSNLFSWRQSYALYSLDTLSHTRDEVVALLARFSVAVVGEDADGVVLRCAADEAGDNTRGVRFRVELSTAPGAASFHPLSPSLPSSAGGRRASKMGPDSPYECMIVLVQEKGSMNAFKSIYHRLRAEWRLDALHTPGAFGAPSMSAYGYEQGHRSVTA